MHWSVLGRLDVIALIVLALGGILSLMALSREWQEFPTSKVPTNVKVGRYVAAAGAVFVAIGSSLAIGPPIFENELNTMLCIYGGLGVFTVVIGIALRLAHKQMGKPEDFDEDLATPAKETADAVVSAAVGVAIKAAVAEQVNQMQAENPAPAHDCVCRGKESKCGRILSCLIVVGFIRAVTHRL